MIQKDILSKKVNELRQKYSSEADLEWFNETESEIDQLFADKSIAEHPVFVKIAESALKKLNEVSALLMNDRNLTENDRWRLFAEQDVWRFLVSKFKLEAHDRAIIALEEVLDNKLEK